VGRGRPDKSKTYIAEPNAAQRSLFLSTKRGSAVDSGFFFSEKLLQTAFSSRFFIFRFLSIQADRTSEAKNTRKMEPKRPTPPLPRELRNKVRQFAPSDAAAAELLSGATRDTSRQDIIDLINEHWGGILRKLRTIQAGNHGKCPLGDAAYAICREMALTTRDEVAVYNLLRSCTISGADQAGVSPRSHSPELLISIEKLHEQVAHQQRNKDWKLRFQAAGCLDPKVQLQTTGVIRSANSYMRKYKGPPFAISGDSDHVTDIQSQYFVQRVQSFRNALLEKSRGAPKISREAFTASVASIDRYGIGAKQLDHLFSVLDPHKTGFVSIDEFCERFSFEFLKPRSLRNSMGAENCDGTTDAFQWKSSLTNNYNRKEVMQNLQHAVETRTPIRVKTTRSSQLKKESGVQMRKWHVDFEEMMTKAMSLKPSPAAAPPPRVVVEQQPSPRYVPPQEMFRPFFRTNGGASPRRKIKTTVDLDPKALGNAIHPASVRRE
jgi:hypothetical protein